MFFENRELDKTMISKQLIRCANSLESSTLTTETIVIYVSSSKT
jgi:hypothetical protein